MSGADPKRTSPGLHVSYLARSEDVGSARGANNKSRTHSALFLNFFGSDFRIFSEENTWEKEKFPRHPHFIGGCPAVCTGPSLTIAEKFRIIRRRQRRTFRN